MRVRRCAVVFIEPREEVSFDLDALLEGGNGVLREQRWLALAPHLGHEVEIDEAELRLLGAMSPDHWMSAKQIPAEKTVVTRLLAEGLLLGDGKRHAGMREREEHFRGTHWHPLGATFHAFTRWSGVDTVQSVKDSGTETALEMRSVLGIPPAATTRRAQHARALPRIPPTPFDDLLARRTTCRNFDPSRKVPFALFAQMMQRVFAAQAEVRVTDDTVILKKNVPSGGGLHPMDCYLAVQHVEGVEPGLYHYHAQDHALEALPEPGMPLRVFMLHMTAQQHWFADAHVMVLLAPRFDRTFWKYRRHAKAYRVVAMEAGHLSQMLYLAATEVGLGAFVTGAINEVELEEAFGLDPINQGAMAICGFGWRGAVMETAELDPAERVWVKADG